VRAPGEPHHPRPAGTSGGGSVGRAAAGAIRIGNTVGAAFTSRRVLESVEARTMVLVGAILLGAAALSWFFPRVPAYTLVVLLGWIGLALLYRGYKLLRKRNAKSWKS